MAHWLTVMLYDCRSLTERDRGIAAAIEAVKNGELVAFLFNVPRNSFK